MIEVRESMAHLFGLGLYQDVQVDASHAGRRRRADLQPLSRAACSPHRLRGTAGPARKRSATHRRRAARRVALARARRRRPWRRCRPCIAIAAIRRPRSLRAPVTKRVRRTVSLVFTIRPGARARIGAIDVQGAPREPVPQVLSALGLRVGDEYDGVDLDARLARYANDLRARRVLRSARRAASSLWTAMRSSTSC